MLAAGVRLAIVSNAVSHSERLLDSFGFRDRVSATAMSWSVAVLKPDLLVYRAVPDALGVIPARPPTSATAGRRRRRDGGTAGRRDGELRGARRLGLRAALIERGLPHTESARAYADVCYADLAEAGRAPLHPGKPAMKADTPFECNTCCKTRLCPD